MDTHKRTDDPLPEILRQCIHEGYCWWCGRSGLKCLGNHTYHAHGISADEIRDLAGLFKHQPTCIRELSEACKIRNLKKPSHGIHAGMESKPGRKKQFNKQGRYYQNTVRVKIVLENRPKAMDKIKLLRLEGHHFGTPPKPHKCPACGKLLPTSFPITCSPECRREIRKLTALKTAQIRKRLSEEDHEYQTRINEKVSATRKRLFAEGKLTPHNKKP